MREFILGVLVGPTLFTLFWMAIFGNSAIELILSDALGAAVQLDESVALFKFLRSSASDVASRLAIVMVLVFFVTSAD